MLPPHIHVVVLGCATQPFDASKLLPLSFPPGGGGQDQEVQVPRLFSWRDSQTMRYLFVMKKSDNTWSRAVLNGSRSRSTGQDRLGCASLLCVACSDTTAADPGVPFAIPEVHVAIPSKCLVAFIHASQQLPLVEVVQQFHICVVQLRSCSFVLRWRCRFSTLRSLSGIVVSIHVCYVATLFHGLRSAAFCASGAGETECTSVVPLRNVRGHSASQSSSPWSGSTPRSFQSNGQRSNSCPSGIGSGGSRRTQADCAGSSASLWCRGPG